MFSSIKKMRDPKTHGPTDKPAYLDAWTHLNIIGSVNETWFFIKNIGYNLRI